MVIGQCYRRLLGKEVQQGGSRRLVEKRGTQAPLCNSSRRTVLSAGEDESLGQRIGVSQFDGTPRFPGYTGCIVTQPGTHFEHSDRGREGNDQTSWKRVPCSPELQPFWYFGNWWLLTCTRIVRNGISLSNTCKWISVMLIRAWNRVDKDVWKTRRAYGV